MTPARDPLDDARPRLHAGGMTRRPTPPRPPRTPPARALSDQFEDALRRFLETDPLPEVWEVPVSLLAEFARRLPARKETGQP